MQYRLTDYLTAEYKIVIRRLRVLTRRERSAGWLLDQLADAAGAFDTLRDQGYRQSAGAVMLALLDFLRPFEDDPRYRAFASDVRRQMKVYGLNSTWCRYHPPVKPVDARIVELTRQHAPDFGDKGVDDSVVS